MALQHLFTAINLTFLQSLELRKPEPSYASGAEAL